MATPHNEAKKGDIAPIVIMPGDPLRAKEIAKKYLTNAKLVNSIRGMYAYTGTYKGKKVTVMAHGMGMPSAGIYVYELYKYYNVKKIIRIGSCGCYKKGINLMDIILVDKSYTESNFAFTLNNEHATVASASEKLTNKIANVALKNKINIYRGNAVSSDCFDWYMTDVKKFVARFPKKSDIIACEMESFAIFYIAKLLKKEAACLLTVVDSHYCKEDVSAKKRQTAMNDMITLALDSIL